MYLELNKAWDKGNLTWMHVDVHMYLGVYVCRSVHGCEGIQPDI